MHSAMLRILPQKPVPAETHLVARAVGIGVNAEPVPRMFSPLTFVARPIRPGVKADPTHSRPRVSALSGKKAEKMAKREREKAEKSGRTHVVGHDGTDHRTKYRLATSAGRVRGVHHPEKTPSQVQHLLRP